MDPELYQNVRAKLANEVLCGRYARSSESEKDLPPQAHPSRRRRQQSGSVNYEIEAIVAEELATKTNWEGYLDPSEVGGIFARVGSLADTGERGARRSGGDVGAVERGEEHGGVPRVEGGASCEQDVSSAVRACPFCSQKLTYNEGTSLHPLNCDGPEHVGPTSIKHSKRFSCFSCGRYVTCGVCTASL